MIGRKLAHYRIVEQLGSGGMGVVYRARDERLQRDVALKVLPATALTDEAARKRFRREALALSQLNHPNICTIYEVGEAEGQTYIAMEYIQGRPLSESIPAEGLALETVVHNGRAIGDALAHAHERGVLHRDLKTSNVMVTPDGRVKVLDFGLAKRTDSGDDELERTRTHDTVTQTGSVVGTLAYLAPELLAGSVADARSDIWALGVVVYEMACGKRPFDGPTPYALTSAILRELPAPLPPRLPVALRAAIQKCLSKEPGHRYQSAAEVRGAFETLRVVMSGNVERKASSAPTVEADPERTREQLARILASSGFARNERLSNFLRFVVQTYLAGKADHLKESVIGVEVFGRRPDYDPRQDSVVRTEAAKLRARLTEYYAGEGAADPVVIEIRKGGYIPSLRLVEKPAHAPNRRHWVPVAMAAAAAVFVALLVWRTALPAEEPKTIAVLPFENRSGTPDGESISDGLTDEIIQNLSVIEGLEVRSRTSTFAFKNKPRNVRDLGDQLHANYLLEGSIARSAESLRINARLVRVRDDLTLWSGKYDREAPDIFTIQDEISRSIVNQLRLKLGGGQRRYNTSVEAYELYLKAKSRLGVLIGPEVRPSIPLFEQVLAKDGGFAPAYAGLAKAYASWSSTAFLEGVNANPRIKEYVDKALELDPLLAEAWALRGVELARDYRWSEAESAFQRALQINPNLVDAHLNYATGVLFKLGKEQDSLQRVRRACQLDPLSPDPPFNLTFLLANLGRTKEAWTAWQQLNKLQPRNGQGELLRSRLLLQDGRVTEAIAGLEQSSKERPAHTVWLGYAYGLSGQREAAQRLLATWRAPSQRALICAGLKDKECVIDALNGMAEVKDPRVHYYMRYPELSLVRGDPRLQALHKKVGL